MTSDEGLRARRGAGRELLSLPPHARFRLGLAYVPEERRIVPGLTVRENLQIGLVGCRQDYNEAERIDEISEMTSHE